MGDSVEELVLTDEEMVHHAFEWYCDVAIDMLVQLGVDEGKALDVFFSAATILAEDGTMPVFPGEGATYKEEGLWLVRAKDENFLELVLEAVDNG